MKDFRNLLILAGMNSMITGGDRTARVRGVAASRNFLYQLTMFTENA